MKDLESGLSTRVQSAIDGFRPCLNLVDAAFGSTVDYAMLVKIYSADEGMRERYSPSDIVDARPAPVMGRPEPQFTSAAYTQHWA
jgi:hypothetical protein